LLLAESSTGDPLIQPTARIETQKNSRSGEWCYIFFLSLLGAYANVAVYGFEYPAGPDYSLFLPLTNWLRDPSLYPGDAIRDVFPHIQTFYWPVVAFLSRHFATEHILFGLFILTKLIFFAALALLIAAKVRSRLLGACMVAAIALSGMLNSQTPIGGTVTLSEISEHDSLALAIVLLAGVLLVQGRWRSGAIVAGLSVYIDALQFVHMLPAFALFAIVYWREEKRQIISSAALGAGVFLPWFVHFHKSYLSNYPSNYVSALLINYPLHITLRWTPVSQIIEAAVILLATACMCFVARRGGLKPERRLELLAVSYLIIVVAGILAGWFWLTPGIARFMLPRADSLLIPYAFLLIQLYGAQLLESRIDRGPATTCLLAVLAILSPLCIYVVVPLFFVAILSLDPKVRLERFFVAVFGRLWKPVPAIPVSRIVAAVCAVGILAGFFFLISSADQLWNFRIPPSDDESACYDAQLWARDHTPREASFLVPPVGCGFRIFSERSSWGEWSDGNAMYFYPAFADTFLKRVEILDPAAVPSGTDITDSVADTYQQQSWDRIQAVANENNLDYIVQSISAQYPAKPVYANAAFAIYSAK
jgi:hypothetical protein